MTAPSILRPEISVPLNSGAVVVREMAGLDTIEFLELLAKHMTHSLSGAFASDGAGALTVDMGKLLPQLEQLVRSTRDLVKFLLTRSLNVDEAKLASLGTMELLTLLDAAIAVNLTQELIELGKKVGGRMQAFLVAGKSPTPKPAIS